jgi:hypothetical protein
LLLSRRVVPLAPGRAGRIPALNSTISDFPVNSLKIFLHWIVGKFGAGVNHVNANTVYIALIVISRRLPVSGGS